MMPWEARGSLRRSAVGGRSGVDLASPAKHSDDECDHRRSEKNVDQTAPDVEREVPEQPENEKDDGNAQHDF